MPTGNQRWSCAMTSSVMETNQQEQIKTDINTEIAIIKLTFTVFLHSMYFSVIYFSICCCFCVRRWRQVVAVRWVFPPYLCVFVYDWFPILLGLFHISNYIIIVCNTANMFNRVQCVVYDNDLARQSLFLFTPTLLTLLSLYLSLPISVSPQLLASLHSVVVFIFPPVVMLDFRSCITHIQESGTPDVFLGTQGRSHSSPTPAI